MENAYQKKSAAMNSSGFNFRLFHDKRFRLSVGLFLILVSVFLFVSFLSYLRHGQADQSVVKVFLDTSIKESGVEVRNVFGLMGAIFSHYFIFLWFGVAAILIPPLLFVVGYRIAWSKAIVPLNRAFVFIFFYLIWISFTMGCFLINEGTASSRSFLSGGVGFELAILAKSLTGRGALMFAAFLFLVFNVYFFNVTQLTAIGRVSDGIMALFKRVKSLLSEKRNREPIQDITPILEQVKMEVEQEDSEKDDSKVWTVKKAPSKKIKKERNDPELIINPTAAKQEKTTLAKEPVEKMTHEEVPMEVAEEKRSTVPDVSFRVERKGLDEKPVEGQINYDPTLNLSSYEFPDPSLLTDYPEGDVQVTKEELEQNKDRIVETLINFKIRISSIKATIGPTVTLYEIVPKAGIKISKIKSLEDDIALSLAALGIRIIAPIPGKGTIGIEVPNKRRKTVGARSVITSKFMRSNMELPVALGKTISNEVYVTDLSKMPHLLMAGATGQGKSVGLNIILTSLLYTKHPSQLKLVLVDPKKVELTLFNKIERHFLAKLPDTEEAIITDTKKVVNTLNSLCVEMDTRYDLLKQAGCRNLKEYNKKFVERRLNPNKGHRYLPYIVLVIDELADLMMTAGKEVEAPIARLAQLARAIGIHLIVATQRPSVNVITGVIKANFPARLSFKVTSKIDSRTILDTGGADQLVGMGDMLLSTGSDITRLQCAFVDTPEVERVCEFIGAQRGYPSAYMLPEYTDESEENSGSVDLLKRDTLFEDAARLIVMHQQGSTSLIQRKLELGYNRAGRIIDQLEAAGIVGAFKGSKAREVLIPDEHSLEQLLTGLKRND